MFICKGGVVGKKSVLELVRSVIAACDSILSARVYGSWLHDERSVDLDTAIMVKSNHGVVSPEAYRELQMIRSTLCFETGNDIDLVPHTDDELDDVNSPVWYPRYNPSLAFGQDLKGSFPVSRISLSDRYFTFSDLTAYVLHDNRTICRRQLVRSLNREEGRIFVSKLLHGPGNALTYHACRNKLDYQCSPSEITRCFQMFDEIFGVDSSPAMSFLRSCKLKLDQESAINLMRWYENLMNLVLKGSEFIPAYSEICSRLAQ